MLFIVLSSIFSGPGIIMARLALAKISDPFKLPILTTLSYETRSILGSLNNNIHTTASTTITTTTCDIGIVVCSGQGQICDTPSSPITITTSSVLEAQFTTLGSHCSTANYFVSVDGGPSISLDTVCFLTL